MTKIDHFSYYLVIVIVLSSGNVGEDQNFFKLCENYCRPARHNCSYSRHRI